MKALSIKYFLDRKNISVNIPAHLKYAQLILITVNLFHTDNYRFAGQNLNEGNAGLGMGMGMGMKFSEKWSANTRTNTEFGHDVDNEVNAYIGIKYQF